MARRPWGYQQRFLRLSQFRDFAAWYNLPVSERELEFYEQHGFLIPTARVVQPAAYVRRVHDWKRAGRRPPAPKAPSGLLRLEESRFLDGDFARINSRQMPDVFDRNFDKSPYLHRPAEQQFRPWKSFEVPWKTQTGDRFVASSQEVYYGYWQVHQLADLSRDVMLNEAVRALIRRLPSDDAWLPYLDRTRRLNLQSATLRGWSHHFDALSYWVTVSESETRRAFALIPAQNGVRVLSDQQQRLLTRRQRRQALLVAQRFGLDLDELVKFVVWLLDRKGEYDEREQSRLAATTDSDIRWTARWLGYLGAGDWEDVTKLVGVANPMMERRFRWLNPWLKHEDRATDTLEHYLKSHPRSTDAKADAETVVLFLRNAELDDAIASVAGLSWSEDEAAGRLWTDTWHRLRNFAVAFEHFVQARFKGSQRVRAGITLLPALDDVLKTSVHKPVQIEFEAHKASGFKGDTVQAFRARLAVALSQAPVGCDPRSSDVARDLAVAAIARNMSVHIHPSPDATLGQELGQMAEAMGRAFWHLELMARAEGL